MAAEKPWGTPEIIGVVMAAAFHSAIPGAAVGALWSLALSRQIIAGAVLGTCIGVVVFVLLGVMLAVPPKESTESKKKRMFLLFGMMIWLSILAGLTALIVWGFRSIF